MKFYSTSHDYSGRKIKKPKPKGEVYAKFQPPAFRPIESKKSSGVLSYADNGAENSRSIQVETTLRSGEVKNPNPKNTRETT